MNKNRKHTILAVDDDPVQRRLLQASITKLGHEFVSAKNGEEAIAFLPSKKGQQVSAVILDLVMPDIDGMAVLERLRAKGFTKPVIVLTSQGSIDAVVNAMRLGAFDFLVKPIAPEKLGATLANALKFGGSLAVSKKNTQTSGQVQSFDDIIHVSAAMENVLKICAKAAKSTIPVLIEGESGVGKELVAKAIQANSERANKPFVTVNCGALPENLVESLLFGHEKGAFTGANGRHIGKFEEADGGTLFLDEIGELPLELQVKLLRAIQEGEIDPIGAKRPVPVDIRLISATNRDLNEEVKAGRFREDLYYRLSVLPLTIPPLRERREDITPLVFHFVKLMIQAEGKENISQIHPELMRMLQTHDWPGNIRELENAIFRAVVLCDTDQLTVDEFPQISAQLPGFSLENEQENGDEPGDVDAPIEIGQAPDMIGVAVTSEDEPVVAGMVETSGFGIVNLVSEDGEARPIREVEAEVVRFAMEIYGGQMAEAARRLGIGRSTLYRKLRDYGLEGLVADNTANMG